MSSSMQFIHFDSVNGTYTDDPFNVSFAIQSGGVRNIKRLYLKSVEIPIGFYNIRSATQSTFTITNTVLNTSPIFTIPLGYYSDINTLLSAINIITTPGGYTFSLSANNLVVISSPFTNITTDSSFLLTTMLGFQYNQWVTSDTNNVVLTARQPYNLNYDNYLNMYLYNVPNPPIQANTNLCTFKIPLNASNGVIYYLSENSAFAQYVDFSNSNYIMTTLTVQIFDRYNNILINNGLDWSFTLAIETY